MAAPNLNSSSLIATAAVDTLTPANTSEADLTTNAAASGHTFISLSMAVTNTNATGVAATVNWYDGTNNHRLSYTVSVPPGAQLEVAPRVKFLLEGWKVKVTSGQANVLEFQHHYLDCH